MNFVRLLHPSRNISDLLTFFVLHCSNVDLPFESPWTSVRNVTLSHTHRKASTGQWRALASNICEEYLKTSSSGKPESKTSCELFPEKTPGMSEEHAEVTALGRKTSPVFILDYPVRTPPCRPRQTVSVTTSKISRTNRWTLEKQAAERQLTDSSCFGVVREFSEGISFGFAPVSTG